MAQGACLAPSLEPWALTPVLPTSPPPRSPSSERRPAAALALDGSLSCATTEHCDTFGSPPLVPSRAVDVAALEVWAVDVPTTRFEAVETPSQTTATPASTAEGGSSTAQTDPAATTAPLVPSPAGHDAAAEAGEEHAAQSRKPRGRDLNSILAALETADAEEERRAEEVAAAAAQRRRRHSDREAATAEVHVPELVGGQSNILSASHIMEVRTAADPACFNSTLHARARAHSWKHTSPSPGKGTGGASATHCCATGCRWRRSSRARGVQAPRCWLC